MPTPESATDTTKYPSAAVPRGKGGDKWRESETFPQSESQSTEIVTLPPDGVNLSALETRLRTTFRQLRV